MAKELTIENLKEYAKLALVAKAIEYLMKAAKANNMSIEQMSETITAMAVRKDILKINP